MNDILLKVEHVSKKFKLNNQITITALNDVSFSLKRGEIFGLAGQSGCGKSTLARIIAGIYPPSSGNIYFEKNNIIKNNLSYKERASKIQLIFQNTGAALNPKMTVREILSEPLSIHKCFQSANELNDKINDLLLQTGLTPDFSSFYPDELSGGQKQRLNIARALALSPKLIIADEPISSLDISMQAQIINLFMELQQKNNFSCLFIAHDLNLLRFICNRIGIMYKGNMLEIASSEDLFTNPRHDYTKSLLSAIQSII
ncbi:MAG TPA: ATP-binding cassette domain-containing protein [Candidatus Megamonas gallistercoris]|nr:ATP-binding cassette domain-containing protein [Candidatus Megamonas gallistercoris]